MRVTLCDNCRREIGGMGRRYLHLEMRAVEIYTGGSGERMERRAEGDFCSTDCQMTYLRRCDFTLGDAPDG